MAFYNEYFGHASCWGDLDRMFEIGGKEAMKHGIALADSFHIAAANLARCPVLVTAEKSTKPMFRTRLVRVVSILEITRPATAIQKLLC
jgi:hypothetical protein